MKKNVILSMMAMLFLASAAAHAAGIGVYGTGGIARTSWTAGGSATVNSNDYFYGGGLVIDTNAARDSLLNYRFRMGYQRFYIRELGGGLSIPINDAGMFHTLGFGVVRTKTVRFWIGPQVGVHYLFGEDKRTTFEVVPLIFTTLVIPRVTKISYRMLEFDLLLALGFNVNLGNHVTLFLEVGAGYEGKYGVDGPLTGHGIGVQANAGIMFRIKDSYQKKQEKK